jgi:hypothetical protein
LHLSFSPGKGSLKKLFRDNLKILESDGAIKKAFVMTGTGGSVNNKDAEDVLLIQEVLTLVINEWGQETLYSSFLKVQGTWESSGVLTLS